jgi:hypothetical protein
MRERYWLWIGARLIVAIALVAWAFSYLGTGGAEKEFQKTLDAMKQVRTFRTAYSATPMGNQHREMLWEVDCNRGIAHYQAQFVQTNTDPPTEMKQNQLYLQDREYDRNADGSWTAAKYNYHAGTVKGFCSNLAQGTDTTVLPQIATMIRRGILQKGDKKTINGVRCREWLVTMKGGLRGLEHDTLCLGLEDHLPYEMTVDWENSRTTFSDYNTPIQIEMPEAAVQPASTATDRNQAYSGEAAQ